MLKPFARCSFWQLASLSPRLMISQSNNREQLKQSGGQGILNSSLFFVLSRPLTAFSTDSERQLPLCRTVLSRTKSSFHWKENVTILLVKMYKPTKHTWEDKPPLFSGQMCRQLMPAALKRTERSQSTLTRGWWSQTCRDFKEPPFHMQL